MSIAHSRKKIHLPPGINDRSNPNLDGPGIDEYGFALSHSMSSFCSTFKNKRKMSTMKSSRVHHLRN